VDHLFLFHPAYEWLKANVSASSIVRIESEGGNSGPYRKGYSPLWDYGAHDLAMILDLLGKDPLSVRGTATDVETIEGGLAGSYEVGLEFAEGVCAHFRSSNRLPGKVRKLRVETSGGTTYNFDDVPAPRLTGPGGEIPLPTRRPVREVIEVFCKGIAGAPDARWGLELGVRVVGALERCERAVRGLTTP
jgi:predicted dehydrogenase